MASNPSLIKSISEAATLKGVDVPATEGLTNVQLTAALRDLNKRADAPEAKAGDSVAAIVTEPEAEQKEPETAAEDTAEAAWEPEVVKAPAFPFSVAPGKSLTGKRGHNGMFSEGDEITAEDFPGGEERLEELVESGHVVKA